LQKAFYLPTINLMKEAKVEEVWDKKKIAITIVAIVLLLIGLVVFTGMLNTKDTTKKETGLSIKQSVKGMEAEKEIQNIKEVLGEKIEEITKEASSINIAEIASSSPQVQKVINDIKELEKYPSDQAKGICQEICDSL